MSVEDSNTLPCIEKQIDEHINQMGKKDTHDSSVKIITIDIISFYETKDKSDSSCNRYNLLIQKIIEEIKDDDYLPTRDQLLNETEEIDSSSYEPHLAKAGIFSVIIDTYDQIIENDPETANKIALAMNDRLERISPNSQVSFFNDSPLRFLHHQADSLMRAMKRICYCSDLLPIETVKNICDTNLQRLLVDNNQVFLDEEEMLTHLLSQISQRDPQTFLQLANKFISNIETLDRNNKDDYHVLYNLTTVYSHLLSDKIYLPPDIQLEYNEKIFNWLQKRFETEQDDGLLRVYLYSLSTTYDNPFYFDSNLRNQQIKFRLQLLNSLNEKVSTHEFLNDNNHSYWLRLAIQSTYSKIIHTYTAGVLGINKDYYLFESGKEEADKRDTEVWQKVNKEYKSQYENSLIEFLKLSTFGFPEFNERIIHILKNHLNKRKIEDPNHPFHDVMTEFWTKYKISSEKSKKGRYIEKIVKIQK